jgi:mRNA interferase MazF
MAKSQPRVVRRGEIYLVTFDPARGSELKKTRPGIVIQNDHSNLTSPNTILAGITSKVGTRLYPTDVLIPAGEGGLTLDSVVKLDQVRTVDKARLLKRLGAVSPATLRKIDRALLASFGLIQILPPDA